MIFSLLQDSFRSPYRGNERNEKKSGLGNRRNETNRENEKLNNSKTIYEDLCAMSKPDASTPPERMFLTLGGRIRCKQCKATSKRTKQQCRAPAMKGKEVCRTHGALSRGPLTEEGRAKCAAAKTIHGRETRQNRADSRAKMAELYELAMLGRKIGLISGPKTAGRKPGK